MGRFQVVIVPTLTLWCLFSMWLLFPYLEIPRMLIVAAGMLAWIELVSMITWGLASEDCVQRPCGELAETARLAADVDVPVLAGVVVTLAIAEAVRRGRRISGPAAAAGAGRRARQRGSRRSRR